MEEDEELFEVESFLNTRVKDGKRYYKVRWKGFPPEEDTWEPEENVQDCEEALETFWKKRRKNATRKQKKRRNRIMSEEEEQTVVKSSREIITEPSGSIGDIEPLGLTRQASKELAMCLNKNNPRRHQQQSELSSLAGSDVTSVENDVLSTTSSKSNLFSSQTGSDLTSSDNDVMSQSSEIKSSQSGSDVLNRSTESTNGSNSSTDVIDVSSQESFNENDLEAVESSPRDASSGNKTKIEIISLLSDSEDNEAESSERNRTSPLKKNSQIQSPKIQKSPIAEVPLESSPHCSRRPQSSETAPGLENVSFSNELNLENELNNANSFVQTAGTCKSGSQEVQFSQSTTEKSQTEVSEPATTLSKLDEEKRLVLSPEIENQKSILYSFDPPKAEEESSFFNGGESLRTTNSDSSVRRKNRFELSLKKKGRRPHSRGDNSSSESSREKGWGTSKNDGKYYDTGVSGEQLLQTKEKTQLQKLKESMSNLENSSEIKKNNKATEIYNSKTEKSALKEEKSINKKAIADDVCPTITELKGIMYKIAKKDNAKHVETGLQDVEMIDLNDSFLSYISSNAPDSATAERSEKFFSAVDLEAVKIPQEANNVPEEQPIGNLCNFASSQVSRDGYSVESFECNNHVAEGSLGKTLVFPSKEINSGLVESEEKETMLLPLETKTKDENSKYSKETENNNDIGKLNNQESQGKDEKEGIKSKEFEQESLAHKDSTLETEEETVHGISNNSKKVTAFTPESTTRVLKNLRILAAKTRSSKSVESSTNLATAKQNDDARDKLKTSVENNFEELDNHDGNSSMALERDAPGNDVILKEIENKNEMEFEENKQTGIENRMVENEKESNDNLQEGIIDVKTMSNVVQNDVVSNDGKSKDDGIGNVISDKQNERKTGSLVVDGENERDPAESENKFDFTCTTETVGVREEEKKSLKIDEKLESCVLDEEVEKVMNESSISTNNSIIQSLSSTPGPQSDYIQVNLKETTISQGIHGDQIEAGTFKENFQKHSTDEENIIQDQITPRNEKDKRSVMKIHEKTSVGKALKRKKLMPTETNNLDSENLNSQQGTSSSSSTKIHSKTPKAQKRIKTNKQARVSKKESASTTGEKISKISRAMSSESNASLESVKEGSTRKIVNANFSSSLTSGDLIGSIIDEENSEKAFNENIKKKSSIDEKNTQDIISGREEEDMSIEDDEESFDFELEDFPLEKLLQDEKDKGTIPQRTSCLHHVVCNGQFTYEGKEDDMTLRYIPSPPVAPLDVPFADVKAAIREGDEMTVRAALAGGLELDTRDGASGMTLLMIAAASGQDTVVEILLRRKADVNACQKNGMTALMHACEQGYPETAHVLLLSGADINKQQIAGETALMKACKKGHTDVIEVLLKNGVDIKLESKSGRTAHQFSTRTYPELTSLIEEHDKRLGRAVEEAILLCLGDTVSLCKPAILSHRCIVPREGQQMTFPFQYYPQIYNKDVDVIVFCIKAIFSDVVSLLFGEDNGIRGVLLNNKPQIPLLHGVRSIFPIDPKPRLNTITLQTHKCSNPASKVMLCIYAVQSRG